MIERAFVCCADLHLMADTPIARTEEDILVTLKKKLDFIDKLSYDYQAPVIIAGDVFDHWKTSPELLSFAFDHLPKDTFAIYGNHDLPHHNLKEVHRTGLNILFKSERVIHLIPEGFEVNKVMFCGFDYGAAIKKCNSELKKVAVIHRYVSPEKQIWQDIDDVAGLNLLNDVKGYDMILTGDCHTPFVGHTPDGTLAINPGSILRKTAAQLQHKPRVYVWFPDREGIKQVKMFYLPTEDSVTREHLDIIEKKNETIMALVNKLKEGNKLSLDYKDNLLKTIHSTPGIEEDVEDLLISFME